MSVCGFVAKLNISAFLLACKVWQQCKFHCHHFEKVECFLMPYPGKEVARSQKFMGEIDNIKPKFLENIKILVEYLIDNVKPKKVLGKEENGKYLMQVLKNYVEILNSGVLPEPKSLIQLQMDVLQKNAENECMEIYNDNMREGTKNKLLKQTEMDELHKECAAAALDVFDKLPDFGNQEQIRAAKSNSSKILEGVEYGHYKSTMKERVENKLLEIFHQAKSNHSDCLESATRTLLNSNDLERKIVKSHKEALNYFKNHTHFGDLDRNKELIETLIKNMRDKEKSCLVDMKRRIEKHYNEVLNDCKIQYKKLMEMKMMTLDVKNYVAIWTEPVSEMNIASKSTTLTSFNSKLEVCESNLLDQFEVELQNFMDIELVNYEAAFQKHRLDMATAAASSAAVTGFAGLLGFIGNNADMAQ